jgi:transglutaminase superfamily protein
VVTADLDRAYVRARLTTPFRARKKLRLVVEILRSYARLRLGLRRQQLPALLASLRVPLTSDGGPTEELDDQLTGVRLGRAVGRTLGALPADSRCLVRSLVLIDMLARRGIQADFVLGVRPGPKFEAHAWVEKGGVPLLPPYEGEYSRLVEL